MATKLRARINPHVYQQAAEWLVLFREGEDDAADRRRFELWLRNSAECVRAYLEIAEIWKQGAALDPQHRYDADELIAEGRRGAGVVLPLTGTALPAGTAPWSPAAPVARALWRRRWLAAAACAAFAAAGLGWLVSMQRAPTYSTVTGEQRSFSLADGSQVVLNSGTEIRVRFGERERKVELISGQALFTVAKEPARPFLVDSGGAQVRAVGTQFDVYRKAADTIVTVIEGKVLTQSVLLSAGDQLTIRPEAPPRRAQPDLAVVTAWTQRQLVFKGARLADVAEEYNRYNDRKLSIEDARLRDFLIDGIFSSTDPTSMLNFLRMQPGTRMREEEGGVIVSGAPPAD
jgi:transmembrane sensor